MQDLSNFPSDVTSGTPKDVESKETKLKFEQFSYCSPTGNLLIIFKNEENLKKFFS